MYYPMQNAGPAVPAKSAVVLQIENIEDANNNTAVREITVNESSSEINKTEKKLTERYTWVYTCHVKINCC